MTPDFELIKELDEQVGVKEHKWYGKEDSTEETQMHDKGKGELALPRMEVWKLDPTKPVPTKEQLLTPEYIQQIKIRLWSDGLRLAEGPTVRIDGHTAVVGYVCVPATGQNFLEEPKYLQEWLT